jgi:hypothetical protein
MKEYKKCSASNHFVFPGVNPHQHGKRHLAFSVIKSITNLLASLDFRVGNGVQVGSNVIVGIIKEGKLVIEIRVGTSVFVGIWTGGATDCVIEIKVDFFIVSVFISTGIGCGASTGELTEGLSEGYNTRQLDMLTATNMPNIMCLGNFVKDFIGRNILLLNE